MHCLFEITVRATHGNPTFPAEPVADARVCLISPTGEVLRTTYTTVSSHVVYSNLAYGDVIVGVYARHYIDYIQRVVLNEAHVRMDVLLERVLGGEQVYPVSRYL